MCIVVVLMRMFPLRLMCLNAWSPVYGTVWEELEGVALLEDVQLPPPLPETYRSGCEAFIYFSSIMPACHHRFVTVIMDESSASVS